MVGSLIQAWKIKEYHIFVYQRDQEDINRGYAPFAIYVDGDFFGTADTWQGAKDLVNTLWRIDK